MEFGSTEGGWTYPVLRELTAGPLVLFAVLAPVLVFFLYATKKRLAAHERAVVVAWVLAGFAFQVCIRALAPFSPGNIVLSEDANSFYSVTLHYTPGELLGSFHEVAATLPIHARANMPGKVLLYYLLETVTTSPEALGYLIMFLSNVGGILVYAVVGKMFNDPTSALYVMVLYLLFPAKLFFFPLLNTVTPIFILLPLLLLLLHLESRRRVYLVLEGASLYALVIFEPLPLVLGLVFVALLARAYVLGKLGKADLARTVGYVAGTFLVCHFLMLGLTGFDVWKAFWFAVEDARAFNAEMGRPYSVWVLHNLKDFLFGAGLLSSAIFLGLSAYLLGRFVWLYREKVGRRQRVKAFLTAPEALLTLSILLVLVITDVLGVNRGETTRLWIFLAVFVQIIAARRCAVWGNHWVFPCLVTATLLQTVLTISVIGFVIP